MGCACVFSHSCSNKQPVVEPWLPQETHHQDWPLTRSCSFPELFSIVDRLGGGAVVGQPVSDMPVISTYNDHRDTQRAAPEDEWPQEEQQGTRRGEPWGERSLCLPATLQLINHRKPTLPELLHEFTFWVKHREYKQTSKQSEMEWGGSCDKMSGIHNNRDAAC